MYSSSDNAKYWIGGIVIFLLLLIGSCLFFLNFGSKDIVVGTVVDTYIKEYSGSQYYFVSMIKEDGTQEVFLNKDNSGNLKFNSSDLQQDLKKAQATQRKIQIKVNGVRIHIDSDYRNILNYEYVSEPSVNRPAIVGQLKQLYTRKIKDTTVYFVLFTDQNNNVQELYIKPDTKEIPGNGRFTDTTLLSLANKAIKNHEQVKVFLNPVDPFSADFSSIWDIQTFYEDFGTPTVPRL